MGFPGRQTCAIPTLILFTAGAACAQLRRTATTLIGTVDGFYGGAEVKIEANLPRDDSDSSKSLRITVVDGLNRNRIDFAQLSLKQARELSDGI